MFGILFVGFIKLNIIFLMLLGLSVIIWLMNLIVEVISSFLVCKNLFIFC